LEKEQREFLFFEWCEQAFWSDQNMACFAKRPVIVDPDFQLRLASLEVMNRSLQQKEKDASLWSISVINFFLGFGTRKNSQ
jgi:hypothetical protein